MPRDLAPRGFAARQLRELQRNADTPKVVRTINECIPEWSRDIYARLSETERARLRLSLHPQTGKIVIESVVKSESSLPDSVPMTLAEVATAIRKARQTPMPVTSKESKKLYAVGHRPMVQPESVAGIWRDTRHEGYRTRLDVLRRGPSIVQAEVSLLPHDGNYDNNGHGYGSADGHAGNIINELSKARPGSVSWHETPTESVAKLTARPIAPGEDNVPTAVIAEQRHLRTVVEVGGEFGLSGEDQHVIGARQFMLFRTTIFAADRELFNVVIDGADQTETGYTLNEENANLVLDCIAEKDSMLSPAFTSFVMTQEVRTQPFA